MIDPVTIRCDLCKTTEDLEEQAIAARRGCHLCGTCKRALYSIVDGPDDPGLPDDDARGFASSVRSAWPRVIRATQEMQDRHVQGLRDAEEAARVAELQARRAAEEQAAKEQATETARRRADKDTALAEALSNADTSEALRVALAIALSTDDPDDRIKLAAVLRRK